MLIRQGTIKEMLSLWYKKNTSDFFVAMIIADDAEFWTIDYKNKLIGELYIFKDLDYKHFADGATTVYLCAFRVSEEFQGKGFGTKLMDRVFKRIEQLDFKYVTIGVEEAETANMKLYSRMGFSEVVKICDFDPCDVKEDYSPVECPEYILLKKAFD